MKKWTSSYLYFSRMIYIILIYATYHAVNSFQHDYSISKISVSSRVLLKIAMIDGNRDFDYEVPAPLANNGFGNTGDLSEDNDFINHEFSDDDDDDDDDDDSDDGDDDGLIADSTAFLERIDGNLGNDRSLQDSPITVGSTVKETIQAIVHQVLAQRSLAAKRIKWVHDRLEVTVTSPPPSSDEVVDLSAPPSQPSIDELDAVHRAIYETLETQPPLAAFLETCEVRHPTLPCAAIGLST